MSRQTCRKFAENYLRLFPSTASGCNSAINSEGACMTIDERRARRVGDLLADMSLDEKLAQLVGVWLNVNRQEGVVAPLQDSMQGEDVAFEEFARHGLGQ